MRDRDLHSVGLDALPEMQEPNFFTGVSFEVGEIILGLNVLTAKVRQLRHSAETRNVAAMKLDAEGAAKIAGQIEALASHLGSVCVRHMARRPR